MKKKIILMMLVVMLVSTLVLSTPAVLAGNKNQNDETNGKSVERGTGKVNGQDGCVPPAKSGDRWVYVPSGLLDGILADMGIPGPYDSYHEWKGGPCCPSNMLSDVGSNHPLPNQCCNGPDYFPAPPVESGESGPGNHCVCFGIRGYPFILLPTPPT